MNVDTHTHHTDLQADQTAGAAPHGPFARIVAASLAAGLATALTLSLLVLAGHTEAAITGAMLVGFAVGGAPGRRPAPPLPRPAAALDRRTGRRHGRHRPRPRRDHARE